MILGSKLAVSSLDVLQPFFLALRPRKILHLAIIQIFPVVGVGVKRILVTYHLVRQVNIDVVDQLPITAHIQRPSSFQFTVTFEDIFGGRRVFFVWKSRDKFIEEVWLNSENLSFDLVPILPFVTRKYSRSVFKLHLTIEIVVVVEVVALLLKLELTVS